MPAPTVIFGGGLAGISAALHLQSDFVLIEREAELGGLARTESKQGFFFDRTGHWLHLRDPEIKRLVTGLMGDSLVEVERRARIFSHGRLTQYPFQANLYGLPAEVIYECLMGYVETLRKSKHEAGAPKNFDEFILRHFGRGIADHFMVPYNHKLWGVHPREITSAWCDRFVPVPSPEQVIAGAVGASQTAMGYNIKFLYPREGGIQSFTRKLVGELNSAKVRLKCAVESVDPWRKCVTSAGAELPYRAVVASIPLPELVARLVSPPAEVVEAAKKLRATSVRYLNVALRRPSPADYHWVYVPESKFPFYRVGVYSNAAPSMAPPGCSSLYVELSSRSQGSETIDEAIRGLVALGAVASAEDVLFADLRVINPAYVIFDDDYQAAVTTIHQFLEAHRIFSRGRYGEWIYNAMEDSLLAGKRAAARIDELPQEE